MTDKRIDNYIIQNNNNSSIEDVLVPLSRIFKGEFHCQQCRQLRLRIAHLESELKSARIREKEQKEQLRRFQYNTLVMKNQGELSGISP